MEHFITGAELLAFLAEGPPSSSSSFLLTQTTHTQHGTATCHHASFPMVAQSPLSPMERPKEILKALQALALGHVQTLASFYPFLRSVEGLSSLFYELKDT